MRKGKNPRTRTAFSAVLLAAAAFAVPASVNPPPAQASGGLSVSDASVVEGHSGPVPVAFTVRLPEPAKAAVSFRWATGTGSAGTADFSERAGTGRIGAGQTQSTVTVPVTGDRLDEYNESFYVTIFDPVGATIADGTGLGTITDDDLPPTLAVADITVAEADDTGTTVAPFAVSLSAVSGRSVTFSYTTVDGTLVAPADYRARAGSITVAPGVNRAPVSVAVVNDNVAEPPKSMAVRITAATNATVADSQGGLRFTDDDGGTSPLPGLVINEIDYDQPGTDTREFVEIYNRRTKPAPLDGLSLVFHNGFDGRVYKTVALKGTVPAGGFAVVAASGVAVDPKASVIRFAAASSNIQNGAPDAVTLTAGNNVIDSVSYEGRMQVAGEGTTGAPADSDTNVGSIARTGGRDTGDNGADFKFVATPTPGR